MCSRARIVDVELPKERRDIRVNETGSRFLDVVTDRQHADWRQGRALNAIFLSQYE
jgi:hypothetical protein